MMMTTKFDVVTALEAELADTADRMCEAKVHPEGLLGHLPAQDASWVLQCPMCPFELRVCDGRLQYIHAFERGMRCNGCERGFYTREWGVTAVNP